MSFILVSALNAINQTWHKMKQQLILRCM